MQLTTSRFLLVAAVLIAAGTACLGAGGALDLDWLAALGGVVLFGLIVFADAWLVGSWGRLARSAGVIAAVAVLAFIAQLLFG